ncbi:MAG TPA: alanine--glyoxylate aminotransferase family protein [Candidatus Dormibacteraeota bacterium]|nr:alanine--glyoxylate aminotransferase family protein [Candidatus Dormibacteraeota bacterium]
MINHRGPEFAALLSDCVEGLKWALQTDNDILLYPASGTGGLEAAATNLLSPGEKALFCTIGSFGERWADIAQGFGADVVRLAMPWGEPVDPADVERILDENPAIRKVFVTHNETSTAVTNDIKAIAEVVKRRGLLIAVDSVSGVGSLPLPVDEWELDVVVTGSQKGWMAPPGLAMISVSADAYRAADEARCTRWYFDFAREKKFQDKQQTYTTPPVSVMYALQEGLAIMREEGLENVWARHARVAEMTRQGLTAIGLELFAPDGYRSNTVTAVHAPTPSADELKGLLGHLRTTYGLVLAGGQGQLQGKIFRVGHLGYIDEGDVYSILATIEQGLQDKGLLSRSGLAVAAAQAAARGAVPQPAGVG